MNTENNKIIAEFMWMTQGKPNESRWKNDWFEKLTIEGNSFESGRRHEYLHFDTDWNWLMEVVEKIESLSKENETYSFSITKVSVRVLYKGSQIVHLPIDNTKIEAVYNACVEFIKWYNEQK